MKNNNIPQCILCPTPELARQVLEKIESESYLKWTYCGISMKPTEVDFKSHFPLPFPWVIDTLNNSLGREQESWYREHKLATNFTKAEDYLNNNYMTEKTWDNLSTGDILIDKNNDKYKVLGICGEVIFYSIANIFDLLGTGNYLTKRRLVELGYKIKGASEDKPSIDDVIEILDKAHYHACDSDAQEAIMPAIEMLKKLK